MGTERPCIPRTVKNGHILTVVLLILVVLAVLHFGGTMQIPVLDKIDEYTLGSQKAAA